MIRISSVAVLLVAAATAAANTPEPLQAPLPSAITSARTLFLGNAGDQENADCLRAYNDLYADLTKLNRFTLTENPATADLILEMHYEIAFGQSDGNGVPRQFRVVLLDPHTHAVLWSLTERTNSASLQKNRDKNLDEVVATLTADFNALTSAQPPSNNSLIKHGLFNH